MFRGASPRRCRERTRDVCQNRNHQQRDCVPVELDQRQLRLHRPDWVIAGDFIYGDYPAEYLTEDERQDLIDELDMIDINAILEHHDNTPRADA